jgi:hypothetical protein
MSSLFVKKVGFQCVSGACRVDVFRCLSTTRPPMKWSGEKSAGRSEKKNRSPNAQNSSEEVGAKRPLPIFPVKIVSDLGDLLAGRREQLQRKHCFQAAVSCTE